MAAVRRLFGWMAGLAGIAALARVLSTRRARVATRPPPTRPGEDDPAEVLRQKLSDSRGEHVPGTATVSTAPAADEPTDTLDERRARIHAKAREAIDAMQNPPG
jgi:hypothetical protein